MVKDEQKMPKRFSRNIRKNLISGVFIAIPFAISILIFQWLFLFMTGFLRPLINYILPKAANLFSTNIPDEYMRIAVIVLSITLLFVVLYFIGTVGQNVLGKRIIILSEKLFMKIPIIGVIYSSSKQVVKAISLPDSAVFKSVVLIEFPRPGFKALGFLTGYITDNNGKKYCKVFIPTTPNPTTGFFELIPADEVGQTNINIEDGFKMIISGGVVAPDTFNHTFNLG